MASSDGGGIWNGAVATLSDDSVTGSAAGNDGGGLFNQGTLTLSGGTIAGNTANGLAGSPNYGYAAGGGGIWNQGTLTIAASTIAGNTAAAGDGGGINNEAAPVAGRGRVAGDGAGGDGQGALVPDPAAARGVAIVGAAGEAVGRIARDRAAAERERPLVNKQAAAVVAGGAAGDAVVAEGGHGAFPDPAVKLLAMSPEIVLLLLSVRVGWCFDTRGVTFFIPNRCRRKRRELPDQRQRKNVGLWTSWRDQ